MIVRASDENLLPRLRVRRSEPVPVGEFLDLRLGQALEKKLREIGQKGVAQAVDAFKMLKEQDQPFEMRRL